MTTEIQDRKITKHFSESEMLCKGYGQGYCGAKPPQKVQLNLERVFQDLAEPLANFLSVRMIRKKIVVVRSYLCPKCLGRAQWFENDHTYGRAVDLRFTGGKTVNSWVLYEQASEWMTESGIKCEIYPEPFGVIHLQLDRYAGIPAWKEWE